MPKGKHSPGLSLSLSLTHTHKHTHTHTLSHSLPYKLPTFVKHCRHAITLPRADIYIFTPIDVLGGRKGKTVQSDGVFCLFRRYIDLLPETAYCMCQSGCLLWLKWVLFLFFFYISLGFFFPPLHTCTRTRTHTRTHALVFWCIHVWSHWTLVCWSALVRYMIRLNVLKIKFFTGGHWS